MASSGFIGVDEAERHARARRAWIGAERDAVTVPAGQPTPAAREASPGRAGSPMYHGYRAEIPEGWWALQPVFVPAPPVPDGSARPGIPAAADRGWLRFQAAVLLCRPGTDGREARQEFAAGVLQGAAYLDRDGRYLQASPVRPVYGLLPLEAPSSGNSGRPRAGECLVLLPLVDFSPGAVRESVPPVMMFVNGVQVQWATDDWFAPASTQP